MPSSHAQSLFYFAAYLALVVEKPLCARLGMDASSLTHVATFTSCFGTAASLAYLRVRAGLHTVAQVSVGACLGTVAGAGWLAIQPTVQAYVSARLHGIGTAAVVGLLLTGALVVGSAERVLGKWLKATARAKDG